MSEASQHKLSYAVESVRGTTPTNPRFRRLPDTRTTLNLTKENLTSERLTGDRFPATPRTGANGVNGDIPADLSIRAYDDFIASALQGAWVNDVGHVDDTCTIEQDSTPSAGTVEGDTFSTTNGVVTVETLDAKDTYVVLRYDPTVTGPAVTYELTELNDSETIDGDLFEVTLFTDGQDSATVKAGDTRKSFTILREFSDLGGSPAKPFFMYAGCEVGSWNVTASANNIARSTFTFLGRAFTGPSENAPTNTSYAPANDTEAFDTFSGSLEIDTVSKCVVTDYDITVDNGMAARYVVGCPNSQDPSVGQSNIEGTATLFFEDAVLYEKFVNEESFALKLTLQDPDGNQMIIDLPNLRIGTGTQPDVTEDGPITIPINFTAHKDDTLGSHISVQRIYPTA